MQSLGFVFGVVIVRIAGLEVMGSYAKYTALINISFGVLAIGIYNHYLRNNSTIYLWDSIFGTTFCMLIFLIFIFPIYAYLKNESFINIMLVLLSVYFIRLSELLISTLRFLELDKYSVAPRIIPYILIISTCLILKPKDIFTILLILSISWFSVVFFILRIKDFIQINKVNLKLLISETAFLSLTSLSTQLYANFDQLIISELLNESKLGSYKIGISFSSLVMPLIGVFSFMYISDIKKYIFKLTIIDLKKKFYNQLKINFLFSFLFFIFCFCFLDTIIKYVYGVDDNDAANSGIILSFGIILNVLSMVFSYTLLAVKKDKLILLVTVFGAILNIFLNLIFIKSYGLYGAAWSSVLTQFLVLILFAYLFFFKLNFFKNIKYICSNS